ncbi:T9SS type B sorting domain-containing protein [Hymenobacter convexus]|uniref:T9SS type B sorting domain-containing protein n=1 Tax=Hymenobacter sp. CA1UV-4 TaxID=3063782 RepID=UPI002714390A|nr:gliding motility-associated C-terminal domain-containing protein [Hymenobacter sp. CA1UV-4]MDO7853453.1 gliding motility-associated C-terminal domain-containing protein [Hymenobacter sp. CA1UV-4]
MMSILPNWQSMARVLLLVLGLAGSAQAQCEYFNWYFGDSAGISFVAPIPQAKPLLNGHVRFPQGAAAISDGAGNFQFSSDGYRVWDRNGRLMPGRNVSQVLRNFSANVRQVLALPQPGSTTRYYVFVSQREFYTNEYPTRSTTPLYLPYAVVDMSTRNGLGSIVARDSVRLPDFALHIQGPIYGLACNWAAVRHTNGRDLWLIGVTTEGQYCSWLLGSGGLAATPVISQQPRWISSNGIFKASVDGLQLALLVNASQPSTLHVFGRLELARFNTSTGQVDNAQELPTRAKGSHWVMNQGSGSGFLSTLTGLEFSPDGTRLYADTAGVAPLQYNLLAGSAQMIDATRTPIQVQGPGASPQMRDLKLAPDGNLYVSYGNSQLGRISAPNALGNGCQWQSSAFSLAPRQPSTGTFPLTLSDLNLRAGTGAGLIYIAARNVCANQEMFFVSWVSPLATPTARTWDFGDSASGAANTATGDSPSHTYREGGTYTVTLRISTGSGQQFTGTQTVQVYEAPVVELGVSRTLCADEAPLLSVGPQPAGSTYRWQDGSTGPEFQVSTSGTYRVTVASPSGCLTTKEVSITVNDCPALPTIITPNGDALNQLFVLKGLNAADWSLRIFNRWGRQVHWQEQYDNSWAAQGQPDGVYYYQLSNRTSNQRLKGWLEVRR